METTPATTAKIARAEQIIQCGEIIAKHFNVPIANVLGRAIQIPNADREARQVLWMHLHGCGLSYAAIGRIFDRSAEHVEKNARLMRARLMPEDVEMFESLPKVKNSLRISPMTTTPDHGF